MRRGEEGRQPFELPCSLVVGIRAFAGLRLWFEGLPGRARISLEIC